MTSAKTLLALAALSTSSAFGAITYVTSGPVTVTPTNLGGGRFSYVIQQTANGSGGVRFEGTSSSDIIETITVLSRPVSGDDSFITLSFSKADGTETTLGAVEEIDVIDPTDTSVSTGVVRISGDVGAAGTTWDLASLQFIDISGGSVRESDCR